MKFPEIPGYLFEKIKIVGNQLHNKVWGTWSSMCDAILNCLFFVVSGLWTVTETALKHRGWLWCTPCVEMESTVRWMINKKALYKYSYFPDGLILIIQTFLITLEMVEFCTFSTWVHKDEAWTVWIDICKLTFWNCGFAKVKCDSFNVTNYCKLLISIDCFECWIVSGLR